MDRFQLLYGHQLSAHIKRRRIGRSRRPPPWDGKECARSSLWAILPLGSNATDLADKLKAHGSRVCESNLIFDSRCRGRRAKATMFFLRSLRQRTWSSNHSKIHHRIFAKNSNLPWTSSILEQKNRIESILHHGKVTATSAELLT